VTAPREPVPPAVEAAVRAAVPAATDEEVARILGAYGGIRALAAAVAAASPELEPEAGWTSDA